MNSSPSQGKNGSAIGLTCSWKGEKCQNDITSARDLPSAATNAEQSLRPSFLPRFQAFAIDRLAGDDFPVDPRVEANQDPRGSASSP
jgi:hypothetical protein